MVGGLDCSHCGPKCKDGAHAHRRHRPCGRRCSPAQQCHGDAAGLPGSLPWAQRALLHIFGVLCLVRILSEHILFCVPSGWAKGCDEPVDPPCRFNEKKTKSGRGRAGGIHGKHIQTDVDVDGFQLCSNPSFHSTHRENGQSPLKLLCRGGIVITYQYRRAPHMPFVYLGSLQLP